ncbi:MAG: PP2C family protein-serine/threonine phosphatase, partial [Actinomycetes bacterium]
AALMGHLRTAVHAYVLTGADPGRVLADANRLLTDLDPHLLASCLIVRLDLDRLRARVATAGHYPPLLRRPDAVAEIPQIPPGPLLGAAPRSTYPTVDLPLPTGSILAMYTDGLIEIPGIDAEQNLSGLLAMVDRADGPLDPLADALVRQGSPYGGRTDDTTILLLRITAGRRG